ncbi:UDP-N-acetylmuramoyl-L-alanine--D-glutamate ligase [Acuticoccus sp. MNP-M23]|uniref:UDP-N-acetylmuramoyl-L-alanine--D-glutamate ligase n=1 Tax=Acuticoccus sp. MNP-M23 TaxID=3072793 RepID=UPI0028153403|nr:UDP-N-acetylmuramoyl-L-alanine--D-glutamate ligase [Acuticoccus sp. MNP-M23]WMS40852.1 UDP-N-acetylmuramoyl-L-alanine--D-glutamate ligase [Acuticoccus sp. MNP-M23]
MIAVETFEGKRVAVFGLAGSGLVTAHALAAGGAEILCYDDKRERVDAANDAGLPTGDLRVADFAAFDALVLSPGVPLTHPAPHWTVERAAAAGVPVVGDVALFDGERRARFPELALAAITGTNGKSTTTALLGHILGALGLGAQVGGNIGRPVLDLDPVPGIAVVECSSYQIDLAPGLTPDVGALLNLSPDHIDRHGTFENYAAVKTRLVEGSRQAVIGVDDPHCAAIAHALEEAGKPVHRIGVFASVDEAAGALGRSGVASVGDALFVLTGGTADPVGSRAGIGSLRGDHNGQNAAASIAIAMAMGADPKAAADQLASFPGLQHRMEEVGTRNGVIFVNDSKATNAQSARQALASFTNVHWIAGGVPKTGGIAELADLFGRVNAAYLIGQAADDFAATLEGKVNAARYAGLEQALDAAIAAARPGDVVLLSPACASFDQFRSFEARGDAFRALVKARIEATDA